MRAFPASPESPKLEAERGLLLLLTLAGMHIPNSFLQRPAALLLNPAAVSLRCKRPISSLSAALKENAPIDVHPEVQEALAHGRPVVALETTIVTHGMPYPINRETAQSVETNVRRAGAIPATIGLIEGRVKIGLAPHELERLANVSENPSVVKLSRRDLGAAIALKKDGVSTHTYYPEERCGK